MVEKIIDLISTHGIVPVTVFLLALSNALLIVYLLKTKEDQYKNIIDKVDDIKTDLVKHGETSKVNYHNIENLLNKLQNDIEKLFEEIKENEKEGNIQQVKKTVERIKDDLFELKTIVVYLLGGGKVDGKS